MTAPKILLFSRDPGGANQMIMVYRMLRGDAPDDAAMREFLGLLRRDGELPQPCVHTKQYAGRHWAQVGLDSQDWRDRPGLAELSAWLTSQGFAAVATGTSDVDDDTDQDIWRAAARCGIPSYAFLDHASNPVQRFIDRDGALVHPDIIFAHDAAVRDALTAAGIPAGHLRIGANLYLDAIQPAPGDPALRREIRRGWGLGDDDTVILFASEPIAEVYAQGRTAPYDEFEAIARVIRAIGNGEQLLSIDCGRAQVTLVIRAHPRDRAGKYRALAKAAPIPVQVNDQGPARAAIMGADLVVGMDSSLLIEARQLGVPALSLIAGSTFSSLRGGPCDPTVGQGA